MTTLTITPNFDKKTARFKGTVAAGEHVAVTIQNDNGYVASTTNLRLRVVDPTCGRTLAVFPQPAEEGEEPETWGVDTTPLTCELNLNTVQMLMAVPPAATVSLLFVLDDKEADTLYFKDRCDVTHWPMERGEDVPFDLVGYPDFVEEAKQAIKDAQDAIESAVDEATGIVAQATEARSTAQTAASNSANSALQATNAKNAAQNAQAAAETAQGKAEDAQEAAEAAQAAAEAALPLDTTLSNSGKAADAKAVGDALEEKYEKPSGGIPKSDLASGVQVSLGKADTALQEHQDISSKADKVANATADNLAGLDENGNLTDSGIPAAAIPSDASSSNQVATESFVNSSIATNTATFRGTYNLVTDLGLTVAATEQQVAAAIAAKLASLVPPVVPENNDYCFVQVPKEDATPAVIELVDRYKCTVTESGGVTTRVWEYEWSLNNSSFTEAQWAAINSGITSADVAKLSALPDASTLAAALLAKVARTELFPLWAANTAYTTYSLVIHENAIYKCTTAHTSGAEWDSTKWAVASGAEVLAMLRDYRAQSNKPSINGVELLGNKTAADLGLATEADATLTERSPTPWVCVPAEVEWYGDMQPVDRPYWDDDERAWYVDAIIGGLQRLSTDQNATTLTYYSWDATVTATRTVLHGYQLGSKSDKLLASEAEAEALRTGKANRAANATAGNLAALDSQGNPTDAGVKASDKLDSTSAAPAFSSDSSTQYPVGSHCTYQGKLYKCTTATTGGTWVAASWTADTMTDPDAVLDVTSQNQLRVVAKDGTLLWAQGYDLASTSSATLACDAVNNFTFADGATTQAFALPTAPSGKVGDFGLDIDNSANTGAATMTLTGLDTTFSVVVPEGESLTDMLAIAAGELARIYVTLTTFRVNNLPTWHIVKQVVGNGGATA